MTTTIIRLDPRIDPQADRAHLEQIIAAQHPGMEIIHVESGKMVIAPKDRPPHRVSETSDRETVTLGDRANERTGGELDNYVAGAYQGRRLVSWDQVHRKAEIAHIHPQVAELRGWLASALHLAPWHMTIVLSIDPVTSETVELELGINPAVYKPGTHDRAVEDWLASGQPGAHCTSWTVRANPRTGKIVAREWYDPLGQIVLYSATDLGEITPTRIPYALYEDGAMVAPPILETHWLIGGLPGSGKSGTLTSLLCSLAQVKDLALVMIDPKRVEFAPWRPRASTVVTDMAAVTGVLRALLAEMERRYIAIENRPGVKKVSAGMLREFPLLVVVVDELAEVTSGAVTAEEKADQIERTSALRRLASKGRAAGISLILATQKPMATIIPTELRDMIQMRICHATSTPEMTETVLGAGMGRTVDATAISIKQRGVGYTLSETDRAALRMRSLWVPDDEVDDRAAAAAHLRVPLPWLDRAATTPTRSDNRRGQQHTAAPISSSTPTWSKDADNSALIAALRDTSDTAPPAAPVMPAAVEAAADDDEPLTFNPEDWQ